MARISHTSFAHKAMAAGVILAGESSSDQQDTFAGAGPVMHVARDQEIYGQGSYADNVYRVVFGVVRTCRFSSDGRRQIESFLMPGDVFGLECGEHYGVAAEAVTDCGLVSFRRHVLESSAVEDRKISSQLYRQAMRSLGAAREHARVLGRRGAIEKLAAFLMASVRVETVAGLVDLTMTRQDIGDYLGLTIETVSRSFTEMEREGLIRIETPRRIRLLDAAALADLCE